MKLYAQSGSGPGDKLDQALSERLIDGVILSPKDMSQDGVRKYLAEARQAHPDADIMLDPQFYTCLIADSASANLGYISEWPHFRNYRKNVLEREATVEAILKEYFQAVADLPVSCVIAPNILISQSLESREAVIAKNFIRNVTGAYKKTNGKHPVLASLVICREALQDQREFDEFINDITMLEQPPDGFYIIVAGRSAEAKTEIFHTDVLANWMLLNYSLSINGLQVVNGYSDIMAPFLGAVGGQAGATGWWSNLRTFSMERYFPMGGGRQSVPRYLSKALLTRITFSEKDAIAQFTDVVLNKLPHDGDYAPEPDRTGEALQSWEAIKSLGEELSAKDVRQGLEKCRRAVSRARQVYANIDRYDLPLDQKSRDTHLAPLEEALQQFSERAQLVTERPA